MEETKGHMGQVDKVYSIKIAASDEQNNLYIIATAAIQVATGKCISHDIVASNSPSILNTNIKSTHKDFLNKIQNIIYNGKQLKNITKALQDQSKKSYNSDDFIEELIHYLSTNDIDKITYLYEQLLIRACGMGNYVVRVSYEQISLSDLDKTSQSVPSEGLDSSSSTIAPSTDQKPSDIPLGAKMVSFKFILSPVSGTPVKDLVVGSPVVVRLNPSDPKSLETIITMNLKSEDGSIQPLQGTIHKITHKGNTSEVIVKLGENLYASNVEEVNTVKVKTSLVDTRSKALPSDPTSFDHKQNLEVLKNDSSLFYYILAILGVAAIGVFIILNLI